MRHLIYRHHARGEGGALEKTIKLHLGVCMKNHGCKRYLSLALFIIGVYSTVHPVTVNDVDHSKLKQPIF